MLFATTPARVEGTLRAIRATDIRTIAVTSPPDDNDDPEIAALIAHARALGPCSEDLDEATTKRLSETALSAYQALKLRDYGRIDMRLSKKGEVFVIEANPNPWLASTAEFVMAAKKNAMSPALSRRNPPRRPIGAVGPFDPPEGPLTASRCGRILVMRAASLSVRFLARRAS